MICTSHCKRFHYINIDSLLSLSVVEFYACVLILLIIIIVLILALFQLSSHFFYQALRAALDLGHSNKAVGILMAILEDGKVALSVNGSDDISSLKTVVSSLDPHIQDWSDQDIALVFDFLKDWNTNARFAFVAQSLLNCLLRVHKRQKLCNIRSVAMVMEGVMAYSQRHLDRIDRLLQSSYLLEYVTASMTLLPQLEGLVSTSATNIVGQKVSTGSSGHLGSEGPEESFDIPVIFSSDANVGEENGVIMEGERDGDEGASAVTMDVADTPTEDMDIEDKQKKTKAPAKVKTKAKRKAKIKAKK